MKDIKWICTITVLAFVITLLFSPLSNFLLKDLNVLIGICIILLFIVLGIIFDMIGVSVQASDTTSFHAMASKKIKGAKTANNILKNSAKVSSFCNDVIGDVCNIITGSAGLIVSSKIALLLGISESIVVLIVTSLIAAFTIGGKAMGKEIAIKNGEKIVEKVTKIIHIFKK